MSVIHQIKKRSFSDFFNILFHFSPYAAGDSSQDQQLGAECGEGVEYTARHASVAGQGRWLHIEPEEKAVGKRELPKVVEKSSGHGIQTAKQIHSVVLRNQRQK